jgi:hypothetical protein
MATRSSQVTEQTVVRSIDQAVTLTRKRFLPRTIQARRDASTAAPSALPYTNGKYAPLPQQRRSSSRGTFVDDQVFDYTSSRRILHVYVRSNHSILSELEAHRQTTHEQQRAHTFVARVDRKPVRCARVTSFVHVRRTLTHSEATRAGEV